MLAWLGPVIATAASPGLDYLNRLRAQAGLAGLTEQPQLSAAAALHARYLDANPRSPGARHLQSAHAQRQYLPGFSGTDPASRARAAGYPHELVRENLSVGYTAVDAAIDGLMGAIYHRLVFLDPTLDEVGVGASGAAHVFLLGRSDLRQLCPEPPPDALALAPVDCLGTPITRRAYAALCASIPEAARFRPPARRSCPNGRRLDADYLAGLCRRPPAGALLAGPGRYYTLCGDDRRFAADWVEAFCAQLPTAAAYPHSGHHYQLCDGRAEVHAEWLQQACADLPETARYRDSGQYRRLCDPPRDLRVEYLDTLDRRRRQAAPEFLLWPPDGALDVPPAFFEEEPDPLPDRAVSGYPISLQLDPGRHAKARLLSLQLYAAHQDSWQPVNPTRLLDRVSDPQGALDAHGFALFPLHRLDWDREYVAVAELELDGAPRRLEWGFRTRRLGIPVLTLNEDEHTFAVQSGRAYALYVPPRAQQGATVGEVRTQRPGTTELQVATIDPNTLRVQLTTTGCAPVKVTVADGRRAHLRPAGCAAAP